MEAAGAGSADVMGAGVATGASAGGATGGVAGVISGGGAFSEQAAAKTAPESGTIMMKRRRVVMVKPLVRE